MKKIGRLLGISLFLAGMLAGCSSKDGNVQTDSGLIDSTQLGTGTLDPNGVEKGYVQDEGGK